MTSPFTPGAAPALRRSARARPSARPPALLLVQAGRRLVLRLGQLRPCALLIAAASFDSIAFFSDSFAVSIACRSAGRQLVARVFDEPLGAVDRLIGPVARFDLLAPLLVLVGVRLGFAHHPIDFVLVQAARRGDR